MREREREWRRDIERWGMRGRGSREGREGGEKEI